MKLPFEVDLTGRTVVVTGAGGVLCSSFSKVLAQCGAKVALLDINKEAAENTRMRSLRQEVLPGLMNVMC